MGKVTASILWTGSKERGEALLAAISPDDPDDFTVELLDFSDYVELRIGVTTDGLGRSRSSVDDILACLSAAEAGLDSLDRPYRVLVLFKGRLAVHDAWKDYRMTDPTCYTMQRRFPIRQSCFRIR